MIGDNGQRVFSFNGGPRLPLRDSTFENPHWHRQIAGYHAKLRGIHPEHELIGMITLDRDGRTVVLENSFYASRFAQQSTRAAALRDYLGAVNAATGNQLPQIQPPEPSREDTYSADRANA